MKKGPNGVEWPITDATSGERSTTVTNQKVFAAATEPVDTKAAAAILASRKWRFDYARHVANHVKASLASPDAAVQAATAGLHELHTSFEFHRDGKTRRVEDAMKVFTGYLSSFRLLLLLLSITSSI